MTSALQYLMTDIEPVQDCKNSDEKNDKAFRVRLQDSNRNRSNGAAEEYITTEETVDFDNWFIKIIHKQNPLWLLIPIQMRFTTDAHECKPTS